MKLLFIILVFVSSQAFSQTTDSNYLSQKEVRKSVAEISKIIRKQSIFTDSLHWPEINREAEEIANNFNTTDSLVKIHRFFTKQLRSVGDKHSFFLTGKQVNKIKGQTTEGKQAVSTYLQDGVGYIKVPPCLNLDNEKDKDFANTIRRQIQKLDTENAITGWIVDLRQNTGGNMWPMLAGLNALIKDGTVGYFIYPSSKKEIAWKSMNGMIPFTADKVDNYKIKDPAIKIAVLIDSLTASSGEMTAISFSGLPYVRFFGTPSGGYTTANMSYNLSNGTMLLLASSYVADRNHKKFMDKIIPDEIVNSTNDIKDETLDLAKKWLLKNN